MLLDPQLDYVVEHQAVVSVLAIESNAPRRGGPAQEESGA